MRLLLSSLVISILSLIEIGIAHSKEVACIPRAEMGETTTGQHLYERDADLQSRNLSRFDFSALTVTSAEGNQSRIERVEDNLYKTSSNGAPYYFVTNDERSIVTELSVSGNATYGKVLICN